MKKLILLVLALASSALAVGPTPPGQLGIAVNPGGTAQFLRVNASGALLLAALGPGTSPTPAGRVGVALDPDGNLSYLNVDSSGGLLVSGSAVAGPIVSSGLTESTATMLGRTTAGTGAIEQLTAANVKSFLSLNLVENTALSTWAGTTNLTTLGTVGTGTWNATVVTGQYGGTGVANTGKTITLGGNLTTSGAFGLTLTLGATTNVTLPSTGTLSTLAGSESLTNKKLGSLTSNGIVTTSGGDGTLSVTATNGSGNVVLTTSPVLVTPTLGAATATSVTLTNGGAITDPGTGAVRVAASGTNQNATVAASGTGTVVIATTATAAGIQFSGTGNETGVTSVAGAAQGFMFDTAVNSNRPFVRGFSNFRVLVWNGSAYASALTCPGGGVLTVTIPGYGAGALTTDASGNIIATSDGRLKNVNGSFSAGLAEIKRLSPVVYRWKKSSGFDTENDYAGFIAQDVQRVIPSAVGKNPDGMLTLNDRPITAALVNAVQELDTRQTTDWWARGIALVALGLAARANLRRKQ